MATPESTERRYRDTQKRSVDREQALLGCDYRLGLLRKMADNTPSPSERLSAREESAKLEAVPSQLPEHYRRVLHLRYQEKQTFAQIGAALNCLADAARKLWARAVNRLQTLLESPQ